LTPTARLLDITRLSSRIGRVFTGVDRVELAYLRAVHKSDVPDFAIAKTALGYVLLDHMGIDALLRAIAANDFPRPDLVSRLNRRLGEGAKVGQTLFRKLSVSRSTRSRLPGLLAKALPQGFAYINVGHSNLTKAMLSAVKSIPHAKAAVLIHDTIPLDFPQFQRPGTVAEFEAKLALVGAFADVVLCISEAGATDVQRHLTKLGKVPPVIAAHLGVEVAECCPLPKELVVDVPYFVTVGTIEPRKNHALLLNVWEAMGPVAPTLFICGGRGWNNEDIFARLEVGTKGVVELNGLSDGALATLVKRARASLFPSFAEGFGLPPVESLLLGTPAICSDLPVLRETLGNNAVYLDPTDVYQWKKEVMRLADADWSQGEIKFAPSTWDAHFKTVFTMT